ncbi:hypothetical protein [Ensifer canadensis]
MTKVLQLLRSLRRQRDTIIETADFDDLPNALARLKDGPNPGNRVVAL